MIPLKCFNAFSQCPIKICVITVVILGFLPLMTVFAQENITNPSDYLPSSATVTEPQQSSRLLSVTKSSSRSGTTSTVRPWPSHNFFRSVLSKTDNVVVKKRNGSSPIRKRSDKTGIPIQHHTDSRLKDQTDLSATLHHHHHSKGRNKKSGKNYRVRKNYDRNINKTVFPVIPESSQISTEARSEIIVIPSENATNKGIVITTSQSEQSSQPENVISNGTKDNEHSQINSPKVGFQYKIVVPPPAVLEPRPPLFEFTVSTTLSRMPSSTGTTTATSTALEYFYHNNGPSGSNSSRGSIEEEDGSGENNRNTSNSTISAVSVNDMGKNVTNDDTTTTTTTPTPPQPLESQAEESGKNNAETAVEATLASSSLYNKGNEMILQNPQLPPMLSPPPTHPLQLNAHLLKGGNGSSNSGGGGESITSNNNKSHLPYSVEKEAKKYLENVNKIHTEIKKNDPWTINHNSGNIDSANNKHLLKGEDRKENISSVNTAATTRTTTGSPPTSTFSGEAITPYNTTPLSTYEWKTLPTRFSSTPPYPTNGHHASKKNASNHTFNKRILLDRDYQQTKEINFANNNTIRNKKLAMKRQTELINRRNMFTVVKTEMTNPRIRVESRNVTTATITTTVSGLSKSSNSLSSQFDDMLLLHDRTNQVERPLLTTAILAGPDKSMVSASPAAEEHADNSNDYFDEDDSQASLHHWIESEQGHFVTPSTELPRFTNLTWPYYIDSNKTATQTSSGNSSKGVYGGNNATDGGGPVSSALAVSFQSQGKDKTDFNTQFEFYIPSAAADPHQNPILLAKKQTNNNNNNKTNAFESWTRVPTVEATTTATHLQIDIGKLYPNDLKQNDHKGKIKHSHWGSKGLSSIKPQNYQKAKSPYSQKNQQNNVYASSTGSPKSTPSSFYSPTFTKPSSPFTIVSVHGKKPDQNYFPTSPSTALNLGSTWPFGSDQGTSLGHSETASFVTSKTPTNIWYKPIINHFTASVPYNGNNTSIFNGINNDEIFSNAQRIGVAGSGGGAFVTTTMQPPSTRRKGYVGGGGGNANGDDTFTVSTNTRDKTIPGKLSNIGYPGNGNNSKNRILFKVWSLVDGKLKLENQREIPAWALDGYLIPTSGTILNLQQIPLALQPLVTSAMAMNTATEYQTFSNNNVNTSTDLSYIWKPLPILGNFGVSTISSVIIANEYTTPATKSTTETTVATTSIQDESLFDNEYNQIKIGANNMPWQADTEVMHNSNKQPISINYVLWNNPASIYDQSIILSTPTPPQTLLSRQPTPVSYFPSSTITFGENTSQYSATIKNPGSSSSGGGGGGTMTKRTTTTRPSFTTTMASTSNTNVDQERLELLFQKYFQYFITTSTPATTTTTTTTRPVVSLANRVTETYGGQPDNTKAWKDLQKLILRLASSTTNVEQVDDDDNNKASATLDKEKTKDLDYLGNVAAIALIMSYLRNKYEQVPKTSTTPPPPYGVTDDMTPPNKDQLWATVYPLFQHFLNNPNYTFIPPPPPLHSSHAQVLSESSTLSLASIMTPTSPTPIFLTEPPTGSSGNYFTSNNDYNHYASYYPTTPRSALNMIITQVPRHGATTQYTGRSEEHFDDNALELETATQKSKTLLLFKKLKKKKKKKKPKTGFFGTTLIKRISKPIFKMKKKQKKYWLDLKFEIDFIQILKKKLLFLLAYKYMPVAMVLAFGLIPVVLSLVPLLYKLLWMKYKLKKKPKYIKVKVPEPYPSPYPVPVYKQPPSKFPLKFYDHHHHNNPENYSPPNEHFQRPKIRYENEHGNNNDDVFHIDSPPTVIMDHHYAEASDTMGKDNSNEDSIRYAYKNSPKREDGNHYLRPVNSFNYDHVRHPPPTPIHGGESNFQQYPHHHQNDQEIHVHLHDEESRDEPQILQAPVTHFPVLGYTSYTRKDLQPYPVTKSYEVGFDIGQALAGIANKHDMEIFKILMQTKKEKINKLLDMWNLAKYGAAVASDAAVNAMRGPTTPVYSDVKYVNSNAKRKKRRRKRRKKRKNPNENSSVPNNNLPTM